MRFIVYVRTNVDWDKINPEDFYQQSENHASLKPHKIIERWNSLFNLTYSEFRQRLKQIAEANLDMKAYKHYPTLTREEIKTLIVDEKWFTTIETKIQDEIIQVSQILDRRLKELTERYEKPLPEINEIVSSLEEKVNQHLERMGFSWR